MPGNCARWCLLLIATLILAGSAGAADQDFFDIYTLEVEGEIYGHLNGEFDGDGLTDIIIIYSPLNESFTRYAGLYLQKEAAGFRPRADYLIPLPSSAVQVDVGDVDRDGLDELLIIDGEGVLTVEYTREGGLTQPRRIIKRTTVYAIPAFYGIITAPFYFDIFQDGIAEIIIPVPRGYMIYERGDDGRHQVLNQLSVPIYSRHQRRGLQDFSGRNIARLMIALPTIEVIDGNGDNRLDLYFLWDHKICSYFQDETGNFAQDPEVEVLFAPGYPSGYMQSRLADCNGDHLPDAVVTFTTGGITNTETKLRFYISDNSGRIGHRPVSEISLSDSYCNLMVNDYDRDGRPEVIIPAVEMGAIAASKMFLLKKADLHLLVYNMGSGLPGNEPEERIKLGFRFDFDHHNPTGEVTIDWSDNYNADPMLDAVFSDGEDRLLFYWGKQGDYLSSKPDLEVTLEHPACLHPVHLNSGNLSDLIVEHNLTGRYDRLTVLKNRNNRQ